VLASIGEFAYFLSVETDVNRPIPTLASKPFGLVLLGKTKVGMATVSETVSKPASASTIRQNLPVFAETRQNSRS